MLECCAFFLPFSVKIVQASVVVASSKSSKRETTKRPPRVYTNVDQNIPPKRFSFLRRHRVRPPSNAHSCSLLALCTHMQQPSIKANASLQVHTQTRTTTNKYRQTGIREGSLVPLSLWSIYIHSRHAHSLSTFFSVFRFNVAAASAQKSGSYYVWRRKRGVRSYSFLRDDSCWRQDEEDADVEK